MSKLATKQKKLAVKSTVKSRKQKIRDYVNRFKVPFAVENDAIDLRAMSNNPQYQKYGGIVPLEDIHRIVRIAIGDEGKTTHDFDPSFGATVSFPAHTDGPQLSYIDWEDAYLWPRFQRDVAPNHINKINSAFDPSCVLVPNAIKVTVNGKVHFCIWDGHHTMQVCRLRGYKRFPVWFVDIDTVSDEAIEKEGFDPVTERIEYGVYIAGRNMIMINSTNKRALANYDEFMIKLETRDPKAQAMNDILKKNDCTPQRKRELPGAFTQFKNGEECYDLKDTHGNNAGIFWDRALAFHRKTWTHAPLGLEIFRPLSLLYQQAYNQNKPLDAAFDDELATLFTTKYGDPDEVQTKIKESFWEAYEDNAGQGEIPTTDQIRVLDGIINLYNSEVGRARLPRPTYRWKV